MDCNAGAALGRQFNKDAMMMHGGMHADPTLADQDVLMQMQMQQAQMPQQDFAMAFQQQQQMAAMRQQHEMEQAFLGAQQQRQMAPDAAPMQQQMAAGQMPALAAQQHAMMNQQMMGGMLAANMGSCMMMPRTQYQPTLNISAQSVATQPAVNLAPAAADSAWADQLGQQQWAQDYSTVQNFVMDGQQDATVEEKTKESNFYKFMDRVRDKEIVIDEEKGEVVQGPGPSPEVAADTEYLKQWAQSEGIHMPDSVYHPPADAHGDVDQMDFERNMDLEEGVEDWAKEYMESQQRLEKAMNNTDYPFEPNNPYLHNDNAFEQGMQMLQLSNLAEAALAFEAVCQQQNDNFEAWHRLGTTQAENEKDALAIIALNNARRINPHELSVHSALSVSHTNEHNTSAAMDCLRAWLLNHPEYEMLGGIDMSADVDPNAMEDTEGFFFADPSKSREVLTLYHAAIEMNPRDADLFVNLGVLHNITHDFDAASESFRKALEVRPEDAKLWNKLGASLANGSKCEEALRAYHRALDINPGYVRAMYNMAVAYSNLSKYHQAAKQIVRAIAVQQGDTNPQGEGNFMASRGMWELLRMTLNLLDRSDLVELSYSQQLQPFLSEFGLEGMV